MSGRIRGAGQLRLLQQALDQAPCDHCILINLGVLVDKLGQTAKALVLIRRALRYAPDDDLLRHALLNHIRRMEEKITDERLR